LEEFSPADHRPGGNRTPPAASDVADPSPRPDPGLPGQVQRGKTHQMAV